jgi:hypothetical protein
LVSDSLREAEVVRQTERGRGRETDRERQRERERDREVVKQTETETEIERDRERERQRERETKREMQRGRETDRERQREGKERKRDRPIDILDQCLIFFFKFLANGQCGSGLIVSLKESGISQLLVHSLQGQQFVSSLFEDYSESMRRERGQEEGEERDRDLCLS